MVATTMRTASVTELLEIEGGQDCYSFGISLFGLELSVGIGKCPLAAAAT